MRGVKIYQVRIFFRLQFLSTFHKIRYEMEKQHHADNSITYFAQTNWRNTNQRFGIKTKDRYTGIFCFGKTGTGKSTLLQNMAIQDMRHGHGVCVIDPHGQLASFLVQYVPESRKDDLVYFDATNTSDLISFNPLDEQLDQKHLLASEIVSVYQNIFRNSWGVRLEYILRFSILTLLENPGTTLLDIQPLLTDKDYREGMLNSIFDQSILSFWHDEFDKYSPSLKSEAVSAILNKSGAFIANDVIKRIIGQRSGSISINDIVNQKKILLVNLSKGDIGTQASAFLGSMLITCIQIASMKKARLLEEEREPFFLFIDEAHTFITPSFAQMLSECRKYKLGLFLSNQYLDQFPIETQESILGNVGTIICFQIGAKDAETISQIFHPVFSVDDLINLPRYSIYLKLMIDGMTSRAFSAKTLL